MDEPRLFVLLQYNVTVIVLYCGVYMSAVNWCTYISFEICDPSKLVHVCFNYNIYSWLVCFMIENFEIDREREGGGGGRRENERLLL